LSVHQREEQKNEVLPKLEELRNKLTDVNVV